MSSDEIQLKINTDVVSAIEDIERLNAALERASRLFDELSNKTGGRIKVECVGSVFRIEINDQE